MKRPRRFTLTACAISLICGLAPCALAQYRRSGDGRILERDLGRYNTGGLTGRDFNASMRFAQNVSFGRAGGGFSFMGDLGTQDYSDFVGGLGSNDLNDFRARSQGSTLAGRGIRGSDSAAYLSSLTSGTRRPNAFRGTYDVPKSTYSKSFQFDTSPDFSGLPSFANRTGNRNRNNLITDPLREAERSTQRSLGLSGGRTLPAADSYGSTALSARSRSDADLGPDSLRTRVNRGRDSGSSGVGIKGLPEIAATVGDLGTRGLEDSNRTLERARQARRDSDRARNNPNRLDNQIDTSAPVDALLDRPSNASPIDLTSYDLLKQRLEKLAPVNPEAADAAPGLPGAKSTPANRKDPAGEFGLPTSLIEPESAPDITGRIGQLRNRLIRGTEATDLSMDPALTKVRPQSGLIGGSDWLTRKSSTLTQNSLVMSSGERAAREVARSRATVAIPGATRPEDDRGAAPSDPAGRPSTLPEVDAQTLRAIREAGGVVDSFLPAGSKHRDIFSEYLTRGQDDLASGRYFQADDNFSRAASMKPDELSAQVARIHAQIGGAVFRTASSQLRRVLRVRPEAAAVRYDAKLLPDKERLALVAVRLREAMQGNGQPARDAALLLSYIGYQTTDPAMQAEGLTRLETLADPSQADTDTRDGLLARFLCGVWAAPDAPPAPLPAAPPAPAPPAVEKPAEPGENPGK